MIDRNAQLEDVVKATLNGVRGDSIVVKISGDTVGGHTIHTILTVWRYSHDARSIDLAWKLSGENKVKHVLRVTALPHLEYSGPLAQAPIEF